MKHLQHRDWSGVRKNTNRRTKKWYKLDLSANVYPTLQRKNYSSVYRISAIMSDKVNPELLQKALDRIMPRFPTFAVSIKKGIFWRYLEANNKPGPYVKADVANPCMPIRFKSTNRYLIRIFYYNNKISFEAFHSIADGTGAMSFFKTLLAQYLRMKENVSIPYTEGVLDPDSKPTPAEAEDAYIKYGHSEAVLKRRTAKAYVAGGTMEPFYTLNIISGICDVDKAKEVAKGYKLGRNITASLGEYLTAVLLQVLLDKQKEDNPIRKREVRVAVPVNLRQFFPSDTLRNFIVMLKPGVDPRMGEYTFEELLAAVHNYMQFYVNPHYLRAEINTNLSVQQNLFVRMIPLFIKDIVVRNAYRRVSDRQSSAGMTNLGIVKLPEKMKPYVERFEVLMGQPFSNRTNVAIATYNNLLTITFTSSIVETEIERRFFRELVNAGIPVKIESNRS